MSRSAKRRLAGSCLAILITTFLAPGCGGGEEQAVRAGLDPAPLRAEIQAVEDRLYGDGPVGADEFDRISRRLVVLGTEVLRDMRDPRATVAGQQLLDLAGEIGGRADVGYATPDMPALRRRWETVRDEVFQPAGWFRHADPARAAQ